MQNQPNKKLNIVSFDVPYPPNYGGAIDVFYKIKNLAKLGVEIYLHTYEYGRGQQKELNKYCKEVYYYDRKISFKDSLSKLPFIVKSRNNYSLIERLQLNEYPILFEGLHTTFPLLEHAFPNRKVLVRAHNIEHDYYNGLKKSENQIFKKLYFSTEAKKLKKYQSVLDKVDFILTISPFEQSYFSKKFGSKAVYIPAFYSHYKRTQLNSKEKFTLWHGDLRVVDNVKAALFVINIFSKTKHKLVIASSFKNKSVCEQIEKYPNIIFENISSTEKFNKLISSAHIHTLITYQKTGIKLKLLNTLTNGKFIIANSKMIDDTGLESTCEIANNNLEFTNTIEKLLMLEFDQEIQQKRAELLEKFSPEYAAKTIINLL